jgi:hypothetical protein
VRGLRENDIVLIRATIVDLVGDAPDSVMVEVVNRDGTPAAMFCLPAGDLLPGCPEGGQ